jgi:stage II sporulation protein D
MSAAEITEALARAGAGSAPVVDLEAIGHGPGGHVDKVVVRRQGETVTLSAARFRRIVGTRELKSTAFDLMPQDGTFQIRGRGWGHGVGLCQWGARGMGLKGYSAEDILRHYYPGSELYRLY